LACRDEAIGDEDTPFVGIHTSDAHLHLLTWLQVCPPGYFLPWRCSCPPRQRRVQAQDFDARTSLGVPNDGRGEWSAREHGRVQATPRRGRGDWVEPYPPACQSRGKHCVQSAPTGDTAYVDLAQQDARMAYSCEQDDRRYLAELECVSDIDTRRALPGDHLDTLSVESLANTRKVVGAY
jgi:hypothetical protein